MRRHALPVGLVVLAVSARLPAVWRTPLSQDEVASARILSEPTLLGALHRVVRTESTPPLWYLLGWLTHHAGVPIVDVRLLSVAFGGALVLVVFRLAELVLAGRYAATAAALVALGSGPVFHGAELRAYELLALVASLLALILVLELRAPTLRLEIGLAVTVAAGSLTHYFFAYSLLAAVAWLWLDPRARAIRRRAILAICSGAVAGLPWLPAFLVQYHHDRFWWIGRYSTRLVAVTPLRLFTPLGEWRFALGLAALVAIASGAAVLVRRSPQGSLVAALAVLPLVTAAATWASGERTYAVRNLIEIAPFVPVVAVAGVASLPRPGATAVAAAAVGAAAVGWSAQASLPPPPYRAIADALIAKGWRPADPIAVYGNFFAVRAPLEWYLPHGPLLDVSRPTNKPCSAVFVIEQTHKHTYAVTRAKRGVRLRGATFLATRRAQGCVRLSTDPRLEPIA